LNPPPHHGGDISRDPLFSLSSSIVRSLNTKLAISPAASVLFSRRKRAKKSLKRRDA